MAALAQSILVVTMVVAGLAKLEHRERFVSSLAELRWLPAGMRAAAGMGVPLAEFGVVGLLVASPRVGGSAALLLLAGFSGVVANEVHRGRRFACGCFGSVSHGVAGGSTLARNAVLCGLALVLLVTPYRFELPAVLSGVGVALAALTVQLATSTITRERFL